MKIENIKFKAKRLDNGEWVEGDLKHSTSYVGMEGILMKYIKLVLCFCQTCTMKVFIHSFQ